MNKTYLLAGVAASLALVAATAASAQSIDYGSLEQMFNEPVTTSATGSPQRASQAPVDMDIISAADIQRSGATDLPTILSRVAGLDVLNWGSGSADVGVRGYNSAMNTRLLVLVNGRQVYVDFFGFTAWSTLPVRLEEIRQIEVVKGPNAALFGFNAVSGVINIITYNPKYDAKGFAVARAGTEDYGEVSLGHTVRLGDRFAARLTAGASTQDEFKNNIGSPILNPVERLTANLDAVTQLADKLELRVEAGWANNRENTAPPGPNWGAKYVASDMKVGLDWDSQFGAVQATAYQNRISAKFAGFGVRNKITVASVQDLFKVGANHTFRVSGEYRKTDMPVAGVNGKFEYEVRTAAGMWNWQALPKLGLTAAARYDDLKMRRTGGFPPEVAFFATNGLFDRRITIPSYNAGLVWAATDMDTVRAAYARGARIPSLNELGQMLPVGPGVVFAGNANLEPTIVTNYSLSYDRALPQIGGSASVRLFYQKSRDVIGMPDLRRPNFTSPAVIFTWTNVSDSDMRGAEVLAKAAYKNGVRWTANYAYTDVDDDPRSGVNLASKQVAYALTTPKHRANLNVGWDSAQWSVDGFVRYQSKFVMGGLGGQSGALQTVDGYATLAGRVARKFDEGFTVALSGQNLTEKHQRQTPGLEVDRRVFLTLSKTW